MAAGYPSRSAWLKQLSSKEYSELLALRKLEVVGEDRRDLGILKLGIAIMRALGVKEQIDPNLLLPIETPKKEQTAEEAYQALLAFSNQWQPSQSEP